MTSRAWALVAALIGASAIGGCGGSDAPSPVASAAARTQSMPGARVALALVIVPPQAAAPVRLTGRGVVSSAPPAADLTMDFSKLFPRARKRVPVEVRVIGHAAFLGSPLFAGELGGRHWLEINEARVNRAVGLGGLPGTGELDSDQFLSYLRSVSGGVTNTGLQTVRGVQTTGYRGAIDLERVAQAAPPDRRTSSVTAVGNLERLTGISSIPFEVWIDGAGRIRRMSLTEGESSTIPDVVKTYVTVDYLSFGREHPARAPQHADVLDLSRARSAALKAALG